MAVVPRYERRQMPSAVPLIRGSALALRPSPEAFGGAQGAALQTLGNQGIKALGAGADLLARMHVDRTLTEARTALTAATKELDEQTTQLRNLRSNDALDVVETGRKGVESIREKVSKSLTNPAARDIFLQRFQETSNQHLGLLLEHQLAQTRVANRESRAAATENLLSQVSLFASDPEMVEGLRKHAQANARAQLREDGASRAEYRKAEREMDSAVYGTRIRALLAINPEKALEVFETHKKDMTAEAIQQFEGKFADLMPQWTGRELGEKAYAKHGRNHITEAIKDLEQAGGTVEERSIAKQRLMQLAQQDNALKRLQDNETLEAFYRNSQGMDSRERLARLSSLPFDPDFRREVMQVEYRLLQAQTEQSRESRYLDLYSQALFNPTEFMQRPLAVEFPLLGDTRYSKLTTLQDSLRKGVQDNADRIVKEGMDLWEKVEANKLPIRASSADAAEYSLRRKAALRLLLEGTRTLFEAGQLGDSAKVSSLQISALSVNAPGEPSLLPDAENPLAFDRTSRTAFEALGFSPRKWAFVEERNHFMTTDSGELTIWASRYGMQMPPPYRGKVPTSLTIDRLGRPLWATFQTPKGAEVWMTTTGRQFSAPSAEPRADVWEGR